MDLQIGRVLIQTAGQCAGIGSLRTSLLVEVRPRVGGEPWSNGFILGDLRHGFGLPPEKPTPVGHHWGNRPLKRIVNIPNN
jgi:hypothetical protein